MIICSLKFKMKHKDHSDIVICKTVEGLPKISPKFIEAAKKIRTSTPVFRRGSVRIAEEISKKNRIKTAHPQPGRWQVNRSSLSDTKYPSYKQAVNKRAVSAPPSVQEYTFYNQSPKQQDRQPDMYKPIHDKLHAWADTANDYEKQVIYNMLSRATKPDNATPSTPPSPREAYHILSRSKSVAAPPPPPQEIVNKDRAGMTASWSPYFKLQQTKHRKTNSAPVKHMLDLVPAATQYPPRDQRSYRLKGQDPRLRENPAEEKMLRGYLDKMARITGNQAIKPEKKFLIVPMHSYKRKKGMDKDYKCDVSFFQSVRAPFKSHFVIHPDFTSEKFAQKKHANQMISHFRY